jgi:ubiquinone biosynthesis protein
MSSTRGPAALDTAARSRQIAEILARHGLGYLVNVFGLERYVPFHRGLLGHAPRDTPYTPPEHLRLAIEELGATFAKLGQLLSTRADLLPPAYQRELALLQDRVPSVPSDAMVAVIEAELGGPLTHHFARFEREPLAAASIGQAHAATLPNGSPVVVKVRRPGVAAQVEADLTLLRGLAQTAQRRWPAAEQYDLVALADEFAHTIRAELDYVLEGRTVERFATNFSNNATIHIPQVVWSHSTGQVLTLERIGGLKVTDSAALDAASIDRSALAQRATDAILQMIFEHGLFHADLHPGNLFIEPDGRIGLIDFGMVGTVSESARDALAAVILAVLSRDYEQLVEALLALGFARQRVDRRALRADLELLLAPYYGRPIGEIALSPLLEAAFATIRTHRLQLPADLALLLKTLIMSEGTGAQLDPQFRLAEAIAPYAERLLRQRYAPLRLARELASAGSTAARLGMELPVQLRQIVADLERGGLQVGVRPEGVEPILQRLERLANRLVLGMLAAAFIVGLAVLLAVFHPAGIERWAGALFAFGFATALLLGIVLAWSILRGGR